MRALVLAPLVALLLAAPAGAQYRRLPVADAEGGLALSGSKVLVGSQGKLTADGGAVALPPGAKLEYVETAGDATVVTLPSHRFYYRRGQGAWHRVPGSGLRDANVGAGYLIAQDRRGVT